MAVTSATSYCRRRWSGRPCAAIRENSAWLISVQRVPVVVAAACVTAFLIKSMVFGDMFRAPLEIYNARC